MASIFSPIARSNTVRNKPRSPAPPQPATPRPFLPPSHYAAAGGFSISLLNKPGEQGIDAVGPKTCRRDHSPRIHSKNPAHIPRTPQIPESESSPGINSVEEFPSRMNSYLRGETSRPGIPNLETQLLPSLKDTIDRMTRPPSASFNSVPGYLNDGHREHRKQRKRISPEPMTTPTQQHIFTKSASKHRKSPIANELTTPNLPQTYSNQSTPTMWNHPSRTKTPVKSALKSSLRSPTPKLFTPDTSATPTSMASPSFKSVKNLLSRKTSGTRESPNTDQVSRKWSFKDPKAKDTSNTQHFSQSNPRTNPHTSRKEESQNPSTAQASSSRIPMDGRSFQSNIPRLSAKLRSDGSHRGHNPDVEGRNETGSREKHKLTVIDAEVSLSSSNSDREVDTNHPDIGVHRGRSTVPTNYRSGSTVGLGLSFPHSSKKEITSSERKPVTNVREDTFLFHAAVQEKSLRFSLPTSESVESTYSDNPTYHRGSFRKSFGTGDLDADHARRRAAFMDIISDLGDLEVSPSQSVKSRHEPPDLPSKYFRNSPTSTKNEGNLNRDPGMERETRSARRHQKERRRSSSCTPKPLASPEEDGEHVPVVPSRSYQPHASPISRCSHASPKTLRELIKNRNLISKSPTPQKMTPSPPPNLPHRPLFYKQNSPVDRSSLEDEGHSDSADDLQSRAHHAHHRHPSAFVHTEASSIAQRYRSAAARERSAFGIPPSESDEIHYNTEEQQQLPHADSDLSFLSESVWQDNCDELSIGAESLFRQLGSGSTKGVSRRNHQQVYGIPPRLSVISPTLSTSSSFGDQPPEVTRHKHGVVEKHSEISRQCSDPGISAKEIPDISQKVLRSREAVIQEIFETEENLLRLLHVCMRQFILPLRVESSRSWITGVPRNVARLLDWFDDIVNLHEQIYQSLCSARDTQSPTTDRVSESLRCFVLKAEVYQPYLIRFSDVSEEISLLLASGESDFGQFINLQERTSECEGWTFEGLLMLPVHRLSAYQTLFSRMLELTSKAHPDYLSTFSLSRSTDLVIKVMTEVKIREDEYNLIKRFSTRIQGLSASSQLATRDRRLLHSGPLGLVVCDHGPTPRAKRNSGSGNKGTGESRRSSKLADSINDWAYDVEKSGSAKSKKSFSSTPKPSTTFAGPPSPNPTSKPSWFSRLPLGKRSRSKSSPSGKEVAPAGDAQSVVDVSLQCMPVHAFVFNDLVLLAQSKSPSDDDPLWVLIQDLGVIKPLSIARISAQKPEDNIVLSLEAISLDANQFDENTEFRSSPFQVVDFIIPRLRPGDAEDSKLDCSEAVTLEPWLSALRRCSQSTLRKLIFPGHQDTCSDQLVDTHLAISSLIGSGLPMPRSPSGHLPQIGGTEEGRFLGDEREERGWWSLRYQQIFREFQRQDSFLSDVLDDQVS